MNQQELCPVSRLESRMIYILHSITAAGNTELDVLTPKTTMTEGPRNLPQVCLKNLPSLQIFHCSPHPQIQRRSDTLAGGLKIQTGSS